MNVFTESPKSKSPPKPGSRAAQKVATRARILDVARSELERVGFEATSIRNVAQAAEVATGTVLLHFRDKQDLLHAALFHDLEETAAAATKKAKGKSLEADLNALARAFFDYYARRPAVSRALLKESLFASAPWSERFAAQIQGVHAHVASLVVAAQARREVASHVDAAVFGAAFFSFYYFALLAWLQGGHPDPSGMFRRLLAQHLGGLRADPAAVPSPRRPSPRSPSPKSPSQRRK